MAKGQTETREVEVVTTSAETVHVLELNDHEVRILTEFFMHVGFYGKYRNGQGPNGRAAWDVYQALRNFHISDYDDDIGIKIVDNNVIIFNDTVADENVMGF